jgi:hypothetical protein
LENSGFPSLAGFVLIPNFGQKFAQLIQKSNFPSQPQSHNPPPQIPIKISTKLHTTDPQSQKIRCAGNPNFVGHYIPKKNRIFHLTFLPFSG